MDECVKGRLYAIRCRNLGLGVYDGKQGFIGIREKFGDEYLFTEYHYDQGPPFGTVYGVVDLGIDVPEGIDIVESRPTVDKNTDREVYFDKPVKQGGRGWVFKDTDEASEDIRPVSYMNKELFDWLQKQRKERG